MLRQLSILVLIVLLACRIDAQTKPVHADVVIKTAKKEAVTGKKNIMLIFHASWCTWCKRLEKVIESLELKPIFTENFVITHLDVMERKEKIDSLENPGGKELMKKFGGEKAGIPFCVFLDKKGKMITNSNIMPDKSNVGYPGADDEIELFAKMLKKAAPKLSAEKLAIITDYLKKNAPQPAAPAAH